jgi:glycosyltransferase involved in cell wall biosynthesis
MTRPEALERMRELDIYLHPSRWEGMPVALIEAQLAALPAVATDVIGNRDVIVSGETGFLGRTAEALSRSLQMLIDDRALRERMGRQARERALLRFTVERMVDEYERLYRTVPRKRASPARSGR